MLGCSFVPRVESEEEVVGGDEAREVRGALKLTWPGYVCAQCVASG